MTRRLCQTESQTGEWRSPRRVPRRPSMNEGSTEKDYSTVARVNLYMILPTEKTHAK